MKYPNIEAELAAIEADIDRIYEALNTDLTDAKEAFHIEELKAAVKRRDFIRAVHAYVTA
jgi:hypothetical protein